MDKQMNNVSGHVWWTVCESLARQRKVRSVQQIATAIPSVGHLALAGCRHDAQYWIHLQRTMTQPHKRALVTADALRHRADSALYTARLRRLHGAWLRLHRLKSPWTFIFTASLLCVPLFVCKRPGTLCWAYIMFICTSTLPMHANVALHHFCSNPEEWCLVCYNVCRCQCAAPPPSLFTVATFSVLGMLNGLVLSVASFATCNVIFKIFFSNYDRERLFLGVGWFTSLCAILLTARSYKRFHPDVLLCEVLHGLAWPGRFLYALLFRFQDVREFVSLIFTRVRSRHRRSFWI